MQTVLASDESVRRYTGIISKKFLSGIYEMIETNVSNILLCWEHNIAVIIKNYI